MHEEEDNCTSVYEAIEEQPSSSVFGEAITQKGGTLVVVQDVPNLYQGMHMFPFPIISMHRVEDDGKVPLHDQGSNDIADLKHQTFNVLSSLDSFKEETKNILLYH